MIFILRLYAGLLRLYPRQFRDAYGDEMLAVFAAAVEDARQRGCGAFSLLIVRELRDLPFNLVREYLHARTLAMPPEVAKFRRARWWARVFSLLSALFFTWIYTLLFVRQFAPQAMPAMILVYVLLFCTILAWVQERHGGLLLMVCGALLGLSFGYASLASGMQPLHAVVVALTYPLPYWLFGVIFLMLGRQKKTFALVLG
ncbi:MAG: hypothetical protein H7175_28960 [Burkholderiales bacterium]|nr:hypothetical protein [Anaerolineae bacterium]